MSRPVRTLIIDNHDSFTYNLYQILAQVNGVEPYVLQNDQIPWSQVDLNLFDNIVISPGPGSPLVDKDLGISAAALLQVKLPVLGVCLGHQGLAKLFGGTVNYAKEVMHGRLSQIQHSGEGLFRDIPQQINIVRYHSLVVEEPLPDCLKAHAWSHDGVLMALCHRTRPLWGVQFHPESILSQWGEKLLSNFRVLTLQAQTSSHSVLINPGHCATLAKASALTEARTSSIEHGSVAQITKTPTDVVEQTSKKVRHLNLTVRNLDLRNDPETIFQAFFAKSQYAFWFDRESQNTGASRFTFMGDSEGASSSVVSFDAKIQQVVVKSALGEKVFETDLLTYLRDYLSQTVVDSANLPFQIDGGCWGYIGYEALSKKSEKIAHNRDQLDAQFICASRFFVIDHQLSSMTLVFLSEKNTKDNDQTWFDSVEKQLDRLSMKSSSAMKSGAAKTICSGGSEATNHGLQTALEFTLECGENDYLKRIKKCQAAIKKGDSYEICLTNKLLSSYQVDPLSYYNILRKISPAPNAAFFKFDSLSIVSASPESFLRIDKNGHVISKPIKGTMHRGVDRERDFALKKQLINSEKDRAENLMIVDLLRNDLGRVCEIGSVKVSSLMEVESYRYVHQLVSQIDGRLKENCHSADCLEATFPGGSMTGVPKTRTMDIIRTNEKKPRGIYSGAMGFFAFNGSADLSIIIRSAVVDQKGTSIGIGGAITSLSEPEAEFKETLLKGDALMKALAYTLLKEDHEDAYFVKGLMAEKTNRRERS